MGIEEAEDVIPQIDKNMSQIEGGMDTIGYILQCFTEIEFLFKLCYLGRCRFVALIYL